MTKKKFKKINNAVITRKELPFEFEKELFENQNKKIHLVTKFIFTKDSVTTPLAGKFYSKYNDQPITKDGIGKKYWELVESLEKRPHEKYAKTVLESHVYGWYQNFIYNGKVYPMNVSVAPIFRSTMIKHGEAISCSKVTERPAFHGKRFFVR